MDRPEIITLVSATYTSDEIGQQIATETTHDVFCSVDTVTQSEFYEAGKRGLRPELRVTMFEPEYNGEETVIVNSKRYSVYRVYRKKQYEELELYLERKVGV